jgi:hypothetical protein
VVNGDFRLLQAGVPAGWTVSPAAVRGVSVNASGSGSMQFVNSSLSAVELIQAFEIGAGRQFAFELLGRVLSSNSPAQSASLEIRWLDSSGSPAADPTVLTIPVIGFGRYSAAGTTSPSTVKAEVHLQLPPGMALEISQISLKTLQSNPVSVTFVSEAPGELRVSNSVVTYDQAPIPPPPAPSHGLAAPTPAGHEPRTLALDAAYCPACGRQSSAADAANNSAAIPRMSSVARCAQCGSELLRSDRGAEISVSSGEFSRRGTAPRPSPYTAAARRSRRNMRDFS